MNVTIVDDAVVESLELFSVTLEKTSGRDSWVTLDPKDGVISISDNDGGLI